MYQQKYFRPANRGMMIGSRWAFILCFGVVSLFSGLALSGEGDKDAAGSSARGLTGQYFANRNLSGQPTLQRMDAKVDFDWGTEIPVPGLPADDFSIRWSGQLEVPESGAWTFYTESDDGVRLMVNGKLIIDNWTRHPVTEDEGRIQLEAGRQYDVVLEFYDEANEAVVRLFWQGSSTERQLVPTKYLTPRLLSAIRLPPPLDPAKLPTTARGLIGHYYNNEECSGEPVLRLNSQVDFDWGEGLTKVSGINADHFSVRWTGQVEAEKTGLHTFYVEVDDGARLWVNGEKLIDAWQVQSVAEHSGQIKLEAGRKYNMVLEYYEQELGAVISLYWAPPSNAKTIIPSARLFPLEISSKGKELPAR